MRMRVKSQKLVLTDNWKLLIKTMCKRYTQLEKN